MRYLLILSFAFSVLLHSQTPPAAAGAPAGFVLVKGGSFMMGSEDGEGYEKPVHKVKLSDFYIDSKEVTQEDWESIMGELPGTCIKRDGKCPVNQVWFSDALIYCNKKSIKEGRTPCYTIEGNPDLGSAGVFSDPVVCNFNANGYRLPTEAEWEYAARGGALSKGFTYSGSNNIDEVAWYEGNSDNIVHPVGSKMPNELGIYDMSGNVDEWVWDRMNEDFYEESPEENPSTRDADLDGYRGGCTLYGKGNCPVYRRMSYLNNTYIYCIGVRLVTSK